MKCKLCNSQTEIWYKKLFDDRHGYPGYFDVYKCINCGFGQTKPQLPKNKIKSVYKKYYPRQRINLSKIDRSNYENIKRFKMWRKGLLNSCQYWIEPGTDVLDVGSGLGYSLLYLESIGCNAYGVDPDENAKKVANKFKLNFHHGFVEDNPFGKKRFDYVISNQTLEHTNDPTKFLDTCKSRLKSGGKIILSFPNTNSLTRKTLKEKWLHWHIPYHLNHFHKASVSLLAEKCELTIDNLLTITPNMWTNLQVRRLLIHPKMGVRDKFWDGEESINKVIKTSYFMKAYQFMEEYNLLNRLVDLLGYGESFVIILSSA
jgi:2-polyprenyl-3-methyl-5-hydroxy-6-metoxy-1,4-benzoquinol methylase